ncbi:MAG: polysaccharide export protein Wza [Rariglobus sp.]|jgi:protein involved in polysaccharide export with SLBB domain/capsular polysaccharide biosynthesis protein|nr:polysaccharide export protein Wza [Rariglobus sp.]
MNEENTLIPNELESPRGVTSVNGHPRYRNGNGTIPPFASQRTASRPQPAHVHEKKPQFNADAGSFIDALLHRWYVMFFAGAIMLALGVLLGLKLWGHTYTSTAQLIRNDPSAISELFRPQELATATLVSMIQSPEVLQKTGAQLKPRLSAKQVAARLKISSDHDTDITTITVTAADPATASSLTNRFCDEAVRYTQEIQRQEAINAGDYLQKQLAESEADLIALRKSMPAAISALVPVAATAPNKLQAARDELTNLLLRYTDAHPLVREQRARLSALAEQIAASPAVDLQPKPAPGAAAAPATITSQHDYEVALTRLKALEDNHSALLTRKRLGELIKSSPPGYLRILLPASPGDTIAQRPWLKIGVVSVFFGLLGLGAGLGEILSREFLDRRIKTLADVKRVTQLPVIATLGDVRRMSAADQNAWAFRTWIALQGRLTQSATHGLICGITSSHAGDGRSTWIRLLAHAASQCGFRVLTVTTAPEDAYPKNHKPAPVATPPDDRAARPASGTAVSPEDVTTITTNALSTPTQVVEKLKADDALSMVHIPLPGWVWNLERRRQWQHALDLWRKIDNIVILVELPPASVPEAVLLAENLPNLVWLANSGRSDAMETRTQLDTLRHARSNLVGSVLNHAPSSFFSGRFARWMGCWAVFAALSLASPGGLIAQETGTSPSFMNAPPPEVPLTASPAVQPPPPADVPPADDAPRSFSVSSKAARAPWQQRLTLGPGDILNLSLFGSPDFTRKEVPIGPDGRINFLEAQNVMAAGLTVDELRERLTEELGKFRRAPQPIVQPFAYRSKKYVVLGKVVEKGVFTLERPITIIEAVARARGLETGLADRNLVELADFSRSFLARGGKHLPVNFEKLFLEGDLTQNIPLEPDDYLYFPASDLREVYVLGEVLQPGAQVFNNGSGAIAAIAARGGFTDRAWKKRLLVIRGSLNSPQTFIVNAHDVLAAKAPDFKLQPKDIIYVSSRPWIRAEELLDIAATAFVEGAVVGLTGAHLYSND